MLQALVITLREGFEAFLIVAISLSYLRQSGRAQLIAAVRWGLAAAVAVSALGGYLLYHAANQEWLDGPLAMIAAASVTWMVVHMWRFGRRMKKDIEGHLRESSVRPGAAAFAGERETNTQVFLDTLPVDRGMLWASKVSFALVTTLGTRFVGIEGATEENVWLVDRLTGIVYKCQAAERGKASCDVEIATGSIGERGKH